MTRRGRGGRKNQDIDAERQYARVAFVCTHKQKDRYVRVADEGGVSLSAWLVGVADRAVPAEIDSVLGLPPQSCSGEGGGSS